MTQLMNHPLATEMYELNLEIEALPASEQQTKIITKASAILEKIADLEERMRTQNVVTEQTPKQTLLTDDEFIKQHTWNSIYLAKRITSLNQELHDLRMAVGNKIMTWNALGRCHDEFGKNANDYCAEYQDADDTAMLELVKVHNQQTSATASLQRATPTTDEISVKPD